MSTMEPTWVDILSHVDVELFDDLCDQLGRLVDVLTVMSRLVTSKEPANSIVIRDKKCHSIHSEAPLFVLSKSVL